MTRESEPPTGYSDTQWALVLEKLKQYAANAERPEILWREVRAICDWYGRGSYSKRFHTAKQRRKLLEKIGIHTNKIRIALTQLSLEDWARMMVDKPETKLDEFSTWIDERLATVPAKSKTRGARDAVLQGLVKSLTTATGQPPGVSYSGERDESSGPLFELATAMVAPVDPHATTGIGKALQRAKEDAESDMDK